MTKNEALELLRAAPISDNPSKVNPSLTQKQGVEIVIGGVNASRDPLPTIMEKRVWQVVKNQRRPRYKK